MKKTLPNKTSGILSRISLSLAALTALALTTTAAHASQAYGSVNNFDCVNDTSNLCHGFEIELDDINTSDISYTFDYNHYGTPKITQQVFQDGLLKWHTNVLVDYQAVWTNTGWSAYTAVPTTNIPPTMGHQFTNPRVNFGGEHFGVGYRLQPNKILYFWMTDNGSHTLTRSGQVYVSTPGFIYNPPAGPAQPAQAQAVIPAPILPMSYVCPNPEFSDAVWCKVITTTSQTNTPVSVNDLMTPDTNNPAGRDWRNGQTNTEVETEWQLLQIDYLSSDYNPTNGLGGNNAKLAGNNRGLTNSDDVVTYRYEYYAYSGPYADWDTHEALCQMPGTDGIHGTGNYVNGNGITIQLTNVVVVGKFLGAQMSAGVATPPVGLVDHVPDGQYGVTYTPRTVIISGDTNFTTSYTGTVPLGMAFDTSKAVLYGTPYTNGIFIITVTASSSNNPSVTKTYPFWIAASGQVLPPHSAVDITVSPASAGSATGTGVYTNGTTTTVVATPNPGYKFVNWSANGTVLSAAASYTFTNLINQSLVATFVAAPTLSFATQPHALVLTWPTNFQGFTLQQSSNQRTTNWSNAAETVSTSGTNYQATLLTTNGPRFFRLTKP